MKYLLTTPLDPAIYGEWQPPFLVQPRHVRGPHKQRSERALYVNGGWLYPPSMEMTDEEKVELLNKVGQIIDMKPDVLLLDHPAWGMARTTPDAMRWFENYVFKAITREIKCEIIQYGVTPGRVGTLPVSCIPSTTLYSYDAVEAFEIGWPMGMPNDPDDVDETGLPSVSKTPRAVWIPLVGQHTPREGAWSEDGFRRAIRACRMRGVEFVCLWYDPGKDNGEPRFTASHYEQSMAVLCYEAGWPARPAFREPAAPGTKEFNETLRILAAQPFDLDTLLAYLSKVGS